MVNRFGLSQARMPGVLVLLLVWSVSQATEIIPRVSPPPSQGRWSGEQNQSPGPDSVLRVDLKNQPKKSARGWAFSQQRPAQREKESQKGGDNTEKCISWICLLLTSPLVVTADSYPFCRDLRSRFLFLLWDWNSLRFTTAIPVTELYVSHFHFKIGACVGQTHSCKEAARRRGEGGRQRGLDPLHRWRRWGTAAWLRIIQWVVGELEFEP